MHTKHLKLAHGETFPALLHDDGVPDFWIATYLAVECRPNTKFNTLRNITSRLRHFRDFERELGRNFVQEFERGQFFDKRTCDNLRWYCWIDKKSYSKYQDDQAKLKKSRRIVSLVKASSPQRVAATTCAERIRTIKKFLVFVAETVNQNRLHDPLIRRAIDDMKVRLTALAPKTTSYKGALDPFGMAPHPSVFLKIVELADPENVHLPFRGVTRKRNALMFKVLIATGMRIGELLCLRTGTRHLDLIATPPMIHIRKPTRNDKHVDFRNTPPSQKTIERTIYITEELAADIEDYINTDRRAANPARKHDWLFVNHRKGESWGQPITLVNWNNAVQRIKKVDPELFQGVKTHGFRHTFAYIWNLKADQHNARARAKPELGIEVITEKKRERALMDVMGWTSEDSAAPYLKRYVKEVVDKATLKRIDDLTSYVETSVFGGGV